MAGFGGFEDMQKDFFKDDFFKPQPNFEGFTAPPSKIVKTTSTIRYLIY